jgi:hypothetical protein
MGDYSKCAINTSFNTGTLTGIAANIFGTGLTPKYIPDFAWGPEYKEKADWQKSIAAIGEWKKMKNKNLTHEEIQQLKSIFDNQ